jgi:sialic acid synthase SpsE
MKIGSRDIKESVFIIAEIGANHEGDFDTACMLIEKAAQAGADAVKFQTYRAERLVAATEAGRRAHFRRMELSYEEFGRLADAAAGQGVEFLSTPFDFESADVLDGLVPAFKVASGDLTNLPFIEHLARKGKPLLISTGMGEAEEIAQVTDLVRANLSPGQPLEERLVLLHCVSSYPTPPEEAHLRAIPYLAGAFRVPVGYSDHTLGTLACEAAVALGARIIEKHFTYRKEGQTFRDHALSADPADMTDLVKRIRAIEVLLGESGKGLGRAEAPNRVPMRRSLAARGDIPQGAVLLAEMITFLRPATGLEPRLWRDVLGRKARRAISAGHIIGEEDLE